MQPFWNLAVELKVKLQECVKCWEWGSHERVTVEHVYKSHSRNHEFQVGQTACGLIHTSTGWFHVNHLGLEATCYAC